MCVQESLARAPGSLLVRPGAGEPESRSPTPRGTAHPSGIFSEGRRPLLPLPQILRAGPGVWGWRRGVGCGEGAWVPPHRCVMVLTVAYGGIRCRVPILRPGAVEASRGGCMGGMCGGTYVVLPVACVPGSGIAGSPSSRDVRLEQIPPGLFSPKGSSVHILARV